MTSRKKIGEIGLVDDMIKQDKMPLPSTVSATLIPILKELGFTCVDKRFLPSIHYNECIEYFDGKDWRFYIK